MVCSQPPVLSLWRCHLSPGRLCGVASVRTGLVSTDDGDSAFCCCFSQTLTGLQCCRTQGAMFTSPTSPKEKSWENLLLVFMPGCFHFNFLLLRLMLCFGMDSQVCLVEKLNDYLHYVVICYPLVMVLNHHMMVMSLKWDNPHHNPQLESRVHRHVALV